MSTYISLNKIQIQNANCVSGLTFGFPAVTHFLGYVHALSRQLEMKTSHKIRLKGCAIACHQHQIQAYQPKGWGEYIFAQTRNPLTKLGKTAPIIQEGKMNLTVSLIIECEGQIKGGDIGTQAFKKDLMRLCLKQKLAGGIIHQIQQIDIESANTENFMRKIRRRLLPSFLLMDRSVYLAQHLARLQETNPKAEMLDAWLDFSALKFEANAALEKDEVLSDKTKADWHYIAKPASGYLVPITTGYKAISAIYKNGEVKGTRDAQTPFCFAESAYGIGEWQSPHRLQDIQDALWQYHHQDGWYLCANQTTIDSYTIKEADDDDNYYDF